MTKDQFEDLVLNYVYAIYDDMDDKELRSFVVQVLYHEKRHLTEDELLAEVKDKYPDLCN